MADEFFTEYLESVKRESATRRAYYQSRREKARSEGLCYHCQTRRVADGSAGMCRKCLDNATCRELRKKSKRVAEGKCPCGKPIEQGSGVNCAECRSRIQVYVRRNVAKNLAAGCCRRCGEENKDSTKTCRKCLDSKREILKELRIETLRAYGGLACVCCGESLLEALQLDHIDNDGAEDRKKNGDGPRLWRKLKAQGYPPGYQVLCSSCNFAKRYYGVCPHRFKIRAMLEKLAKLPLTY